MQLSLSFNEAGFLLDQLRRHLHNVETELVHTDKREMQRALASDLERLRTITDRLESSVRTVELPAPKVSPL